MCAKNECSLHSSRGETRAATSTTQPAANSAARVNETPRPGPAVRHKRPTPAAYAAANSTRLLTSIEHPAGDRRREHDDGEERAGAQAEERHESTTLRRRAS